jgi:hypothetical protein
MAGFPSLKKGNKIGERARKPMKGITLDKQTIADLIKQEDGNVSRVAEIMGTTRYTIHKRIIDDVDLAQALKDSRERQLDILEMSCFDRAIESNDTTLQLFLLKTQGRHRGYDQSEAQHAAKDIATAAFDFILNKANEQPKPSIL